MSQNYNVAPATPQFVSVSSTPNSEVTQLAEVFGRVPVQEMIEVLDTQWARERGWVTKSQGQQYEITLLNDVMQQVTIKSDGKVEIERTVPEVVVASADAQRVSSEQSALLTESVAPGNLAFNHVLARAFCRAVPARAREMGWVVTEEIQLDQQDFTADVILHVERDN